MLESEFNSSQKINWPKSVSCKDEQGNDVVCKCGSGEIPCGGWIGSNGKYIPICGKCTPFTQGGTR